MLSAFVCPGAGQFAQRRWIAGLLYLAAILAALVWLTWVSLGPVVKNLMILTQAATPGGEGDLVMVSIPQLALSILCWLAVYAANVLDVVAAHRRRLRAWRTGSGVEMKPLHHGAAR